MGVAWVIWLVTAAAMILKSAVPFPLSTLLATAMLASGGVTLRRYVFLRGSGALRALEWPDEEGVYVVCLGRSGRRLPAVPEGCRRYGSHLWLLRFRTREGVAQLLVDARHQDARALRRLARRLFPDSGTAEGPVPAAGPRGTDTIRPKV